MAPTGWHNKLANIMLAAWDAHRQVEESRERAVHNRSLATVLRALKELLNSPDISILLEAEQMFLNQERALYANSSEEHNSITTALSQLIDAQSAFAIITDADAYRKATATYPAKRREGGLPLDAFREFVKSHTTRLGNRLAGQLSEPEKEILRQRRANLFAARERYVVLQAQALELTPA